MAVPDSKKPLEYWISRSTDPYLDEPARKKCVTALCERVNAEIEGSSIATGILSHKIVSPDQDEALYSLQVVDALVRNCGEKVHVRVGKFRFLNQIVKLVTPRYLGTQTSPEVKREAIKLLYTWQRSMRHVEQFSEVYKSLKDRKIITEDPEIPEEQIMVVRGLSPKLAVFEDEEKARLLKELLASQKPEDLQAANRLIKSLVRNDEQKTEKMHLRTSDLKKARDLCKRLETSMMEQTAEAIGMTSNLENIQQKVKNTFDELLNIRPTLYRYASEAAESEDPVLADILQVNDLVNRWIQKYRGVTEMEHVRPHTGGSEEECADLLGPDPIDEREEAHDISNPFSPISLTSTSNGGPGSLSDPFGSPLEAPQHPEPADVPFIGFDRLMTPALPRRQMRTATNGSALSKIENLIDGDLFATADPCTSKFNPPKPTLNDLCLDSMKRTSTTLPDFGDLAEESSLPSIPQGLVMDPSLVEIDPDADAIKVLENRNIRILAYPVLTFLAPKVKTFIIAIVNNSVRDIQNAHLSMSTSSLNFSVRLQDSGMFDLPAINIYTRTVASEFRTIYVLALDDSTEIELDYSFLYTIRDEMEHTITGSVVLPMKKKTNKCPNAI